MPLVSVIVPCRNVEKYIDQCISSILKSGSGIDMEVLCVDDMSTDRTWQKLSSIADRDERVLPYFHMQGRNISCGACRNIGLGMAKGKYVYFCDSDDYVFTRLIPTCLERCEALDADMCCFKHLRVDAQTGEFDPVEHGLDRSLMLDPSAEVYDHTSTRNVFTMSGTEVWDKFYRRSFLHEIEAKFQPLTNSDDNAFHILTMSRAQRIAPIDDAMYVYRVGTDTSLVADFARGNHLMDFVSAMEQANKYIADAGSEVLRQQFAEWVERKIRYVHDRCEVLSRGFVGALERFARRADLLSPRVAAVLEDMCREKIREIPLASSSDICYHSSVNQTTGGTT